MTTLDNIAEGLRGIGYRVSLSPLEKISEKEVVITLEDLEIEVETTTSYIYTPTLALNWFSDNIVTIMTAIPTLMEAVETSTISTAQNFKFMSPDITREGTAYMITLKFQYSEIIDTT